MAYPKPSEQTDRQEIDNREWNRAARSRWLGGLRWYDDDEPYERERSPLRHLMTNERVGR